MTAQLSFPQIPKKSNKLLQELGKPHVSSFNFLIQQGLDLAVADLDPVEFTTKDASARVSLAIEQANFAAPQIPSSTVSVGESRIFPAECRQAFSTYKGKFSILVKYSIDGHYGSFTKDMGEIPVMLRSDICNLKGLSPKQLVRRGEHEQEWGGYFIVKGHEKIIRMLILTRRNYPVAVRRPTWKMRGTNFTEFGVQIRCVTPDQTVSNNVLHFLTDGTMKLMIAHRRGLYFIPVMLILKALCNYCDQYIFQKLTTGFEGSSSYEGNIRTMLLDLHEQNKHSYQECRTYIGESFRAKMTECPPWWTDEQLSDYFFKRCVLIHLPDHKDKFNALVFMIQKLYSFAQGKCKVEGSDTVMMQEIMLGGHLYLQIVKDKLQSWLHSLRLNILQMASSSRLPATLVEMQNLARRTGGLENVMENFLATGNIDRSSLILPQNKGLTIVAENINRQRYMSHFRAIHRGSFFQEMRTTDARQLGADAWGFICPVHTPDGAPCGLLNHLTNPCQVTEVADGDKVANVPKVLVGLGMIDLVTSEFCSVDNCYTVQLDGRIIGYLKEKRAEVILKKLRQLKIDGSEVPNMMEIVLVPKGDLTPQYPGVYLFTGPARMVRPVLHLATNKVEYIGTFEQVYLDICVVPEEAYAGVTTHMELTVLSFLSNLALMIPMPDCNQSPRNMYQCQMGKQTMGTPCHNWPLQADTKLYRLQTPQSPLFKTKFYDEVDMDDFAMGTNAIVAVISYTGYDMEDAVILSKTSVERGFCAGSVHQTQLIELDQSDSYFCCDPSQPLLRDFLDADGLPYVGRRVAQGEPLFCYYSVDESKFMVRKAVKKEVCYVENVKRVTTHGRKACRRATIQFRTPRNPSVGDKFASRAGQKGICSRLWPQEDLPFTESGMTPDIIFNPHGFPSRMTIAMMIELMAGKSGAVHGLTHDATPFQFSEDDTAIDYCGRLLENAGYNYYGREQMYSGIDGRLMDADIFMGVCYYQRLRHMVSDKWQVRATGPDDALTHQPLKGKKRGGGIRFGEMERDSLISHGSAFLLRDRLLQCSDPAMIKVCTKCGMIFNKDVKTTVCLVCVSSEHIKIVEMSYIFKVFQYSLTPFIKTSIEFADGGATE